MLRADILIYFKKCPKATYKKINCVKLRKCLKSSCCIGWCWCVGSIQYPPVSSLEMLERRTWVVAGRYFAGYYSGGLGTLPSPGSGGREGRRDILKSLPACQGFSFTCGQTQYSGGREGWWGMFEARRSCLVRVELVASRSEAEFHISRFSRLCEKNKKISPIGGYLLEIMREIT